MERAEKKLTWYPKRFSLRLFVAGSLFLLVMSISILLYVEEVQYSLLRLIAFIVGFIGSLLSGYLLLFNVARLNNSRPLLEAASNGLYFHLSPLMFGRVPWDQIDSYSIVTYAGRKFVLVQLERPQEYLNSITGLRRRRLSANLKRFKTPVVLPAGLFIEDPIEVLNAIRAYRS